MITYELTLEELESLLRDTMFPDMEVKRASSFFTFESEQESTSGYVEITNSSTVVISKIQLNPILDEATANNRTPMFISATPEGVYMFNLELMNYKWEPYSDPDFGIDNISISELPLSAGIRILEWYPDFSSGEEYLDSLMGDAEPSMYDEDDTW